MNHDRLIRKGLELSKERAQPKCFWEWGDEKPKTGRPPRFKTRYGIIDPSKLTVYQAR